MLRRSYGQNKPWIGPAPGSSRRIQRDGHVLLKGVLSEQEVRALHADITDVFERFPPDMRPGRPDEANASMFRYEMFNRSAAVQEVIGHPVILEAVEPILGDDCHVISCTAWRNPPGTDHSPGGLQWHVDGGPHVPRLPGIRWPRMIPYPVFVIATHLYLEPCGREDGPTAVVPGSHTSGLRPPVKKEWEAELTYRGRGPELHVAEPGDVGFFVSDVWHRRMPPTEFSTGRFFLQTNYARRDIAQRVRLSEDVSHASEEARRRADTPRKRRLIGLHEAGFYDS